MGDTLSGAMGGVLDILRGNTGAAVEVAKAAEAAPDDTFEPLAVIRGRKQAAIINAIRADLPPLRYRTHADRAALAARYQAKGYTLAQIQAALVRIDD